jgi:predicted RNA-binding Zn-ribbon protein involved in translation (DUF1610 family)
VFDRGGVLEVKKETAMIALFSFTPKACPQCGADIKRCFTNPLSREDFFAGAAHTCLDCGLHYAHADAEKIRQLAEETGDMGRYVKAGEAE